MKHNGLHPDPDSTLGNLIAGALLRQLLPDGLEDEADLRGLVATTFRIALQIGLEEPDTSRRTIRSLDRMIAGAAELSQREAHVAFTVYSSLLANRILQTLNELGISS